MPQESLADLIIGEEPEITFFQRGLKTTVYGDTRKRSLAISVGGVTLAYDSSRFEENPAAYVAEQLNVHQDYRSSVVRDLLNDSSSGLYRMIEGERNFRRTFQPDPDSTWEFCIELAKSLYALPAWIQFKTLRGKLIESVQNRQFDAEVFRYVCGLVNYGKRFVEEKIVQSNSQLPASVRDGLEQWGKIQGDLLYSYSRIVESADKKVQVAQRTYALLFPNSKM